MIGTTFTETPQSVNVGPYLVQGNNVIEFDVIQTYGYIATEDFAVNGSLNITTEGTIVVVPPPTGGGGLTIGDYAFIIIAIVVVAVAAGLFLRAKG